LPSEVGAEEAEEVGVEHLLRDIKDLGAGGSLTDKIQRQLASLKVRYLGYMNLPCPSLLAIHPYPYGADGWILCRALQGLHVCLHDLHEYVGLVTAKKLPLNHEISYLLQNVSDIMGAAAQR
jgi:26S proteasome regulatory subunit N8